MSPHLEAGLGPLELDQLSMEQRQEMLAHLEVCERCSLEYGSTAEALTAMGSAAAPVEPTPALRDRMLFDASRSNRFQRLVEEAARITGLDAQQMSELLLRVDDPSSWKKTALESIWTFPLQGGPELPGAIVGFIKIKPGSRFPEHGHLGPETVLILQGSCLDTFSKRVARRGEVVEMAEGTHHEVVALPGPDFIYLAVARGGISVRGRMIRPGDPNA